MKKFLLSLAILISILSLSAQTTTRKDLWFNEMFTTPSQSNSEFIEMYNTSNSPIDLDCYIIVSYVAPGTAGFGSQGGAYVYNFPTNSKIPALSYYLLASNSTLKFKGGKNVTPSDPTKFSDWSQAISGGYIRKYNYDGTNWTQSTTNVDLQNIMPGDGALLLYRIKPDGTTELVNGIFGGGLPNAVTTLKDLTNLPSSSSCYSGNVTLKFINQGINANTVDIATVAASTGGDHGYAKIGNGLCGSWAKTQTKDEFTPGVKNPTSLGSVVASLTTTQKIYCDNRLGFSITAPTTGANLYSVTVLLYKDNDKDGAVDGAIDDFVDSLPTKISGGSNTTYFFPNTLTPLNANQQYLVVYKTSLGCFDHASVPDVASGTITTTQTYLCGQRVNFNITATNDAIAGVLPIEVSLYPASNGQIVADTVGKQLAVTVISGFTNGTASGNLYLQAAAQNSNIVIVYKSSVGSCFITNKVVVPTAGTFALATTQKYVCGKKVDFTITGNTYDNTYSLPIEVSLYPAVNGQIVADTAGKQLVKTIVSTLTNGSASGTLTLNTADQNKDIVVVYKPTYSCSPITPKKPDVASGSLTSTQTYLCGQKVVFTMTATNDALTYSLPVEVSLYPAVNGQIVADTAGKQLVKTVITSFAIANNTGTASGTLNLLAADQNKNVVVVYKSSFGSCLIATPVVAPTAGTFALATTQKYVCGKKVDFTITGNTYDNTYSLPVEVSLYPAVNGQIVADTAGKQLVRTVVTSLSGNGPSYTTSGTLTLPVASQNSSIVVVYKPFYNCSPVTPKIPDVASVTLTTTQSTYCNKKVDFTISNVEGDVAYAYPITVQLYYDNGTVGTYDPGVDVAVTPTPFTITSSAQLSYSNTFANLNGDKPLLIVYSTSQSCFSQTKQPTAKVAGYDVTVKSFCGKQIEYKINKGTGDATVLLNPNTYLLPATVELHYDLDGDGVISGAGETAVQATQSVTSFDTPNLFSNVDPTKKAILLFYNATYSCFSTTKIPDVATGRMITTAKSYCGKRVDYTIATDNTGDANMSPNVDTYFFPITVELHYDVNEDGLLNTEDQAVVATQTVSSFFSTAKSFLVPDPTKKVILVYKTAYSCFSATSGKPLPANDAIPTLKVNGSISCAAVAGNHTKATYFVEYDAVNASDNATAYPLQLSLYEDLNRSGVIDNNEATPIDTHTINNAPPNSASNHVYTADLVGHASYTIIKAASTQGCSNASEKISSTCVALPVNFTSFTATRNKSVVVLKWETATEQNNKGFYVQRNTNGEWKNIALVFSQAETGNSSTLLSYQYKDANLNKGIIQYRLQQVDIDGKAKYSDVRSVKGEEQSAGIMVYPNPSLDGNVKVVFEAASSRDVLVSDISGRTIKAYRSVASNDLIIEKLRSGFYTIKIIDHNSGTTTVQKVVVK